MWESHADLTPTVEHAWQADGAATTLAEQQRKIARSVEPAH
jgi:hypothetical protein